MAAKRRVPLSPSRADRYFPGNPREPEDNRTPFQRDRDRILYTTAFRRLAEVTQVVSADEGHVFHNRLTHSLEVAQVARRLAEKLLIEKKDVAEAVGGLDPDVAESAALAHDLGHPPFGHVVEQELNALISDHGLADGFEGNAQSFRIVTKLALHSPAYQGLNLTRATLNAVLKYPWLRDERDKKQHKWGAYRCEGELFHWVRPLLMARDMAQDRRKSVEAALMDWADDVTYAVHDASDFYRAGLVALHQLARNGPELYRFFEGVFTRRKNDRYNRAELETAFEELIRLFPIDEAYIGTREQRGKLRNFTAGLIGRYIRAITIDKPPTINGRSVKIDPQLEKEVLMWKELTWHYVILSPDLAGRQHGQRRIVRDLFEIYLEAGQRKRLTLFPFAVRDEIDRAQNSKPLIIRAIADFISGMTERQAIDTHHTLTGVKIGSIANHRSR